MVATDGVGAGRLAERFNEGIRTLECTGGTPETDLISDPPGTSPGTDTDLDALVSSSWTVRGGGITGIRLLEGGTRTAAMDGVMTLAEIDEISRTIPFTVYMVVDFGGKSVVLASTLRDVRGATVT